MLRRHTFVQIHECQHACLRVPPPTHPSPRPPKMPPPYPVASPDRNSHPYPEWAFFSTLLGLVEHLPDIPGVLAVVIGDIMVDILDQRAAVRAARPGWAGEFRRGETTRR